MTGRWCRCVVRSLGSRLIPRSAAATRSSIGRGRLVEWHHVPVRPALRRSRPGRRSATLAGIVLLLIAACGGPSDSSSGSVSIPEPQLGRPVVQGAAFPRTAVYFLEHENLPSAET